MLARQMNTGNIATGNGARGILSNPQAIAQEVERRQAMGVPAMVGDVTEQMRGLTEYSSRGVGPGQSMVREALERRQATQGSRVRQHVQDTMPTTGDPIAFSENIRREAREAVEPLYREAYEQPMYRTEAIQGIERTPAFRNALPQAYDNIRNQIDPATGMPKNPNKMGFRDMLNAGGNNSLPPNVPHFPHPDGDGYVAWDQGLSTEGYDQVIRAMSDQGRAAANVNPVTGRLENTTNSVHINERAGALRSQLMDQNPAYAQAVGRYGDDMAYRQAFENGQDIGSLSGHEVNAQARATPDAARPAWATGAGTALADEGPSYGARYPNGNAANRVRQMLGDDVKQRAVQDVVGAEGDLAALQQRLEGEHQAFLNWQGVNGNSRTAQRQQADSDLDRAMGIPLSGGAVVSQLVNFIAGRANSRFQQEVKTRIAQVVTASDARTVEEALASIAAQVERDRSFRQLLHRSGVAAGTAQGMHTEPLKGE